MNEAVEGEFLEGDFLNFDIANFFPTDGDATENQTSQAEGQASGRAEEHVVPQSHPGTELANHGGFEVKSQNAFVENMAYSHAQMGSIPTSVPFENHPQYQTNQRGYQMFSPQPYQHHYNIPPTPNSAEMYPAVMPHYSHGSRNREHPIPQQYHEMWKTDNGTFTPLVSPHPNGYPMQSNDYNLSPIPSPAIQGLNMNPYHMTDTAESSLTGSPINLSGDDGAISTNERPKKSRKRNTVNSSSTTSMQELRRNTTSGSSRRQKGSSSGRLGPKPGPTSVGSVERSELATLSNTTSASTNGHDPLSSKSISPQLLAESRMAPPYSGPEQHLMSNAIHHALGTPSRHGPATPASIMQLRDQQHSVELEPMSSALSLASTVSGLDQGMEELTLPEAATSPNVTGAHQTPALQGAASAPLSRSTSQAPHPKGILSPPGNDNRNGRAARKRNSQNSTLISPALRPRISPSIKPLLPDSARNVSEETQALLLASKSNYQNILEGNHLPGVNYPSELSNNLTSKRTSHKIAEQGRRNRINTALQEMQSLLPSQIAADSNNEGTDASDGVAPNKAPVTPATPAQQANSKAATVEQATEYIKQLKSSLAEKDNENAKLKAEMQALMAKLEDSDAAGGA